MVKLSIIIPCFNEEKNIIHLYREFCDYYKGLEYSSELIFVDNGSIDKTNEAIDQVLSFEKEQNIFVKKVSLKENTGYGGGIMAGLNESAGSLVGWTHGDLQCPIKDFDLILKKVGEKENKNFFGKGKRINNRGVDSIVSRFHERCASFILGYKMREINAQPKIFNKNFIKELKNPPKNYAMLDTYALYIALKNKYEIFEIDVCFNLRKHGFSKFKNNWKSFFLHIFYNFIYLFILRFKNE